MKETGLPLGICKPIGQKKLPWLRHAVQVTVLLLVIGGATLRNLGMESFFPWLPELRGLCPIGGTQTIVSLFTDPETLLRTDRSNIWVVGGVLTITLLFGGVFCSTICPLGSIQEWIGKLGKKILGKRYNKPIAKQLDKALGMLRYLLLAWVAGSVAGLIAWELDLINPSSALTHLWTAVVPWSAIGVLAAILAASFFIARPWCRWACPYGLIIGLVGKIGLCKIRRDENMCIGCKKCDKACPMHIDISKTQAVSDLHCNRCTACVEACPIPGALSLGATKNKKVSEHVRRLAPLLALILFLAPLSIAWASGWYVQGSAHGNADIPIGREFKATDISPMQSIETLAGRLGTTTVQLLQILDLPDSLDPALPLVDIELEEGLDYATLGWIRSAIATYLASQTP